MVQKTSTGLIRMVGLCETVFSKAFKEESEKGLGG